MSATATRRIMTPFNADIPTRTSAQWQADIIAYLNKIKNAHDWDRLLAFIHEQNWDIATTLVETVGELYGPEARRYIQDHVDSCVATAMTYKFGIPQVYLVGRCGLEWILANLTGTQQNSLYNKIVDDIELGND